MAYSHHLSKLVITRRCPSQPPLCHVVRAAEYKSRFKKKNPVRPLALQIGGSLVCKLDNHNPNAHGPNFNKAHVRTTDTETCTTTTINNKHQGTTLPTNRWYCMVLYDRHYMPATVERLTPRCQTVLLKYLTRLAHPRPSPSRLDWSVRNQTDASSRELDDNPGDITRVLK